MRWRRWQIPRQNSMSFAREWTPSQSNLARSLLGNLDKRRSTSCVETTRNLLRVRCGRAERRACPSEMPFPESARYRKQLMSVPSCDAHTPLRARAMNYCVGYSQVQFRPTTRRGRSSKGARFLASNVGLTLCKLSCQSSGCYR